MYEPTWTSHARRRGCALRPYHFPISIFAECYNLDCRAGFPVTNRKMAGWYPAISPPCRQQWECLSGFARCREGHCGCTRQGVLTRRRSVARRRRTSWRPSQYYRIVDEMSMAIKFNLQKLESSSFQIFLSWNSRLGSDSRNSRTMCPRHLSYRSLGRSPFLSTSFPPSGGRR